MTYPGRAAGDCSDVDAAAVDEAFRLLADGARRTVLHVLRERESTSIDELADVVAGRRAAETGTFVPPSQRGRFRIELDHVHLPMLADHGVLNYDRETGRVGRTRVPRVVEALIDPEAAPDDATAGPLAPDDERNGGQ